jgi:D-amino peptidase
VRIFISADMEGVAGVTHPAQCRPSHPDYQRFRRLMTQEVNAAVQGAVDGGAEHVLVNDSHFTMTNVLLEELHPCASLVSGANKTMCQLEGLDESYDGALLVGYHQGDGEGDGVVNHTLMAAAVRLVRINGQVVDEAQLNAQVAAAFGVPVVLVTGDDLVCDAASAAIPGVRTVTVKRAIDRLSAAHEPADRTQARIREEAAAAVRALATAQPQPRSVPSPARFEVEFQTTSSAKMCTLFPGVERLDPRTIAFAQSSLVAAYHYFWGLCIVAFAVRDGVFGLGL